MSSELCGGLWPDGTTWPNREGRTEEMKIELNKWICSLKCWINWELKKNAKEESGAKLKIFKWRGWWRSWDHQKVILCQRFAKSKNREKEPVNQAEISVKIYALSGKFLQLSNLMMSHFIFPTLWPKLLKYKKLINKYFLRQDATSISIRKKRKVYTFTAQTIRG